MEIPHTNFAIRRYRFYVTVSALQFDSVDAQQLQLGCWTVWPLNSVALRQAQLESLAA